VAVEVWFLRSASREFEALNEKTQKSISAEIERLKDEPRALGTKQLAGHPHIRRARVGNYRILYEVREPRIIIARICSRADVYRQLQRLADQLSKA
jgi:mRNA interferase RelE/StbE